MKKLILLLCTLFCSCTSHNEKTVIHSDNANYNVRVLFVVNGCTVYAFEDRGWDVYFTSCEGKTRSNRADYQGKVLVRHSKTALTELK